MSGWSVRRLDRSLGEYAAAWDTLHTHLFRDNPMLDSRFVDALLRQFGDGSEKLCIFHAGGVPQAMCVLRPAGVGTWATFLPSQAQIGPVLLDRPELVSALLRTLPGAVVAVDFLCNDPDFGDLSNPDNRVRESRDHALTMDIELTGSFDAYWATRSKKLIQNIGRYERRAKADGMEVRLVCVDDGAALAPAVARYADLESKGWKGAQGTAVDTGDAQGKFYLELMASFIATNGAFVYELWFGDRLAAARLCITGMQGSAVMLKTTYDESLSKYSPGRLLLHHVIRHMFERAPGGRIEFYTDANADQRSWATGQRWIRHVSFYRNETASDVFSLLRAGRIALRTRSTQIAPPSDVNDPNGIEVYQHPGEFPRDVAQLFAEAESISIEFGLTWYENLIDTVFPGESGVRFYVMRREGQPVAAIPVLINAGKRGGQVSALANFYSALYAPALEPTVKSSELVPLIQVIRAAQGSLDHFRFGPMDPKSQTYRRLLNALRSAGLVPFQFFCFGNWHQKVQTSWTEYLAARDGALRSTIKRMGKKFAHDGGSLEIVQDGAELDRAITDYETVYNSSWKVPEPFPAFMPGLARACAKRGWLRLGIARLNGRPIAAQIWIVANGKASIYKLAYHEEFKAYAPGTLLTATLMQHVMETDKVAEIDYLIGDDKYKKTWVNDRRERWGILAYNPRKFSGLVGAFKETLSRARKLIKPRSSSVPA